MSAIKHPDINGQLRLLRIEYEEERRAFSRLTDSIGVERLADRGNAWFPIRKGKDFHNSLNQRVVEIYRCTTGGDDDDGAAADDDHNFEYGRPVSFFSMEGSAGDIVTHRFAGTISYVDADRMVVAIPENADLSMMGSERSCGVMLSFDETSYRAMTEALQRLAKADGRLGYLRDLFYSHRKAAERGRRRYGSGISTRRRNRGSTRFSAPRMWRYYTALRAPERPPPSWRQFMRRCDAKARCWCAHRAIWRSTGSPRSCRTAA